MIIEKIGEGETVEEAQENAKKLLNAPEDVVIKFDIISLPSKKILGLFGGKKAQVKAFYEKAEKPKKEKKSNCFFERKIRPEGLYVIGGQRGT